MNEDDLEKDSDNLLKFFKETDFNYPLNKEIFSHCFEQWEKGLPFNRVGQSELLIDYQDVLPPAMVRLEHNGPGFPQEPLCEE